MNCFSEGATAEKTEGGRHKMVPLFTAGRYCGCISPTERRKRPCEDEEQTAEKIRLPIFWLPYFFVL
jgi:hypothetical protein